MDERVPRNAASRGSLASGLRVTTAVVVVGVLLAFADHSLVSARDGAQAMPEAPATTAAQSPPDGFAVPDALRDRSGEAQAQVEAF